MSVSVSEPGVCGSSVAGLLRGLARAAELGARPVAPGLGVDGSEGEVDAWTSVVVLFSHLMLFNRETGGPFL